MFLREEVDHRNDFTINLNEGMETGRDRTRDPWICSQARICSQTRYRLRYVARLIVYILMVVSVLSHYSAMDGISKLILSVFDHGVKDRRR